MRRAVFGHAVAPRFFPGLRQLEYDVVAGSSIQLVWGLTVERGVRYRVVLLDKKGHKSQHVRHRAEFIEIKPLVFRAPPDRGLGGW